MTGGWSESAVCTKPDKEETLTSQSSLRYVRTFIGTVYHPVGTAAMLPREVGGVVDPSTLKVYGTANLRVVDASVFPMIIATHPVATIYAIAERVSLASALFSYHRDG